jgi:beta-N-acetylhexosaminidase
MPSTFELSELESGVGRLFMSGMPGPLLDPGTQRLIADHGLGGVILFSRNIDSPKQLAALCRDLQNCALEHHGRRLFIAVDQEGGRVARLQKPFAVFPGNESIGQDPDAEGRAREFGRITALEMALVGLNMDLAPVVDVRCGELDGHLAGRVFGADPSLVGRLGAAVVRSLQEHGIMAVAKHFPGLGRAPADPHKELPTIPADVREMEQVHLPPFASAAEAGVSAIMTSHAVYPALDPDLPATLSRRILTDLLRDQLGFRGLAITDDLEMGAIAGRWGAAEAAALAFGAGADVLLICRDQRNVLEAMKGIRNALIKGDLPIGRLCESVGRIAKIRARFLDEDRMASSEDVERYFARDCG